MKITDHKLSYGIAMSCCLPLHFFNCFGKFMCLVIRNYIRTKGSLNGMEESYFLNSGNYLLNSSICKL